MKKWLYYLSLFAFAITLSVGYSLTVNADTYDYSQFTAQLYDNYGPSLSSLTTEFVTNRWQGIIPSMTANTSGGAWGISSPIALISNHTYTLSVTINGTYGGNIILSTYNRIGVGTTLSNAVTSYQNNSSVTENYSKVLNDGMTLQFAFTPTINGSYIIFPFATSSSGGPWTFYIENIVIDDLGSSGVTETEINNSLNSQTSEINTSIENSTNTITGAITDVEDSINNTINDNFQSCPEPVDLSYSTGKKFNTSGVLLDDSNYSYTEDYYSLDSSHKITFKNVGTSNVGYVILYNSSKEQIGYFGIRDRTINSPSAVYYRLSTNNLNLQVYLGTGECTNKIDETNDKLDEAETTRKGIWQTIKDLPNQFLDMLKGLFIPEEDEMQELIENFKNTMSEKLGALYQVGDLIVSVFNSILDPPSKNSCITFPEIKDPMFDKLLIEETDYCFDTLRTDFGFLFTISDMIISIVCTLAFANMLYRKFEAFIGGVNSDY